MHLKKLFAGIHKVEFNKDNHYILSMISSADEIVKMKDKIQIEELVENWLSVLSKYYYIIIYYLSFQIND